MEAASHHVLRRQVLVWAVLIGLTALTYGVAKVHLGVLNLPVALLIAVIKASLVALIFMQLLREDYAHRMILVLAVLFVALLICLAAVDATTRFPLATPPHSVRYEEPVSGQLD